MGGRFPVQVIILNLLFLPPQVTVAGAGGFVSPRQFIVVSQVFSHIFDKDNGKSNDDTDYSEDGMGLHDVLYESLVDYCKGKGNAKGHVKGKDKDSLQSPPRSQP